MYYQLTAPPLSLLPQTEEDPNLGKPWFYSTISREDAVELVESSESMMPCVVSLYGYTCSCNNCV